MLANLMTAKNDEKNYIIKGSFKSTHVGESHHEHRNDYPDRDWL